MAIFIFTEKHEGGHLAVVVVHFKAMNESHLSWSGQFLSAHYKALVY